VCELQTATDTLPVLPSFYCHLTYSPVLFLMTTECTLLHFYLGDAEYATCTSHSINFLLLTFYFIQFMCVVE